MNFTGGPESKFDDKAGHGTHVAGTVGALDNDFGVVGVAPGANLWAVKVCKNICLTSDMVAGIDWVVERKAEYKADDDDSDPGINFAVATMSIGHSDYTRDCPAGSGAVHVAFCGLVDEGVVVTLSAGNAARLKNDYPEVISVAAIADFDGKGGADATFAECSVGSEEDDSLADFSNYGVDIAAPGWCVFSTYKDGGLAWLSGTSMATPHVAGAVALYLHAHGLAPATDAAGVNAIKDAIITAALPEGTDHLAGGHVCSYNNEKGSSEPMLFVNALTGSQDTDHDGFHGGGACDLAGTDITDPVISGSGYSNVTATSADITWTTDEASDSVVNYGTTTALGYTASVADLVTSHLVGLSGLTAETTYYYEVQSTDGSANTAIDNNGGAYYNFTTLEADTTDPMISGPGASNITATSADIAWTTDEPADSRADYGLTTSYGSDVTDATLVTSHSMTLTGLTGGTEYHYKVTSKDGSNNSASSGDLTFTTAAAPSEPTTVNVRTVSYSTSGGQNGDKHLSITVALVDDLGSPVGGASVSIDLYRNLAYVTSGTAPTGANGMVAWTLNNAASGCYTTMVTDVTATDLTWDDATPANSVEHKGGSCPSS